MSNREVVSLHIGQAGVQSGFDLWELMTLEHGIDRDGSRKGSYSTEEVVGTFFEEQESGRHVPRCVMLDLEPR